MWQIQWGADWGTFFPNGEWGPGFPTLEKFSAEKGFFCTSSNQHPHSTLKEKAKCDKVSLLLLGTLILPKGCRYELDVIVSTKSQIDLTHQSRIGTNFWKIEFQLGHTYLLPFLLILKHDLCELLADFEIFQRLICFHGWCGNCHLNTTWWSLTFWVNEGHFMAFCRSMCQKMSLMLGQNYMSKTEKTKCPKPCKTFLLDWIYRSIQGICKDFLIKVSSLFQECVPWIWPKLSNPKNVLHLGHGKV